MDMRKTRFKATDKKNPADMEMLQNQEITVQINYLAGLGEGAGEYEGRKVFVPCTTGGDTVRARIVKRTEQFTRAELLEVTEPSKDRGTAICKWFGACGGCTLQHLNEQAYRIFKTGMLTEAVRKAGYDPAICSGVNFLKPDSRRRVEFKVQQVNGKSELGFFKLNSHQLIPVTECPILSPKLDACIAPLREWLHGLEVIIHAIRISEIDEQLDLVIELDKKYSIPQHVLDELMSKLKLRRITVVCDGKALLIRGEVIQKKMGDVNATLPTDIFLQASEEGERWLIEKTLEGLASSKRIVDLFCGIGTYSFPLAKQAKVTAYEIDEAMVRVVNQHAKNMKDSKLLALTRNLYTSPLTPNDLYAFDALVINPPRDGAKAQVEQVAKSKIKKLVMVSCNPATFTRDAAILRTAGFALTQASGLDQFVFSPHLEIVALFSR